MYPLLGLLSIASSLALAEVIKMPTVARATIYSFFAAAVLYTHYTGAIVIVTEALVVFAYGVLAAIDRRWVAVRLWAGMFALVAILFLPWTPHLREANLDRVGHIPNPSVSLGFDVALALVGIPIERVLLLPLALLFVAAIWAVWQRRDDPLVVAVAALACLPAIEFGVSIAVTPVFDLKRAAPFVPGIAFVLGIALSDLANLTGRFARTSAFLG